MRYITPEERNNLRIVVENAKAGTVKAIPLHWQTVDVLLNALEATEARVSDVETSLVRAQNTISEQSAGIDKISAANHALAAKVKKTEDENARLTKERDWLASEHIKLFELMYPHRTGLYTLQTMIDEAARLAVADADSEVKG